MSVQSFQYISEFNRPASEVYRWHERPGALERLAPPWEQMKVIVEGEIKDGSRTVLEQKIGPFWRTWEVEHQGCIEGKEFRDVALRGPFSRWEHTHRVAQTGSSSSTLLDSIKYELPAGFLGNALGGAKVKRELERLFRFRHARLSADLNSVSPYGSVRSMRILVSGSSGLVGQALIPFLRSQGHEVVRLVRRPSAKPDEVSWDPQKGKLNEHALKAIDAVVHLGGSNVAQRWTSARRDEIWRSRVGATRTLVDAIGRMRHRPFVFVSASATGFYGSRGSEKLDETSKQGKGFLADVCEAWERETLAIEELEIRPVMLRTGIVLSPAGGVLKSILPTFRRGLGAQLGNGEQWMSWISIDDLVGAYYHAILDQRCVHAVNAVAPNAVTNREFTTTLARVLERKARLRAPRRALRLAFGEMADEMLFASERVLPEKFREAGYEFRHPELERALRFVLGRETA